jgi:hypothetical protein
VQHKRFTVEREATEEQLEGVEQEPGPAVLLLLRPVDRVVAVESNQSLP